MHEQQSHNDPELNRPYPDPDVPVEAAWSSMAEMLGAAVGPAPHQTGTGGGIAGPVVQWMTTVVIIATSAVIILLVNNNYNSNGIKPVKKDDAATIVTPDKIKMPEQSIPAQDDFAKSATTKSSNQYPGQKVPSAISDTQFLGIDREAANKSKNSVVPSGSNEVRNRTGQKSSDLHTPNHPVNNDNLSLPVTINKRQGPAMVQNKRGENRQDKKKSNAGITSSPLEKETGYERTTDPNSKSANAKNTNTTRQQNHATDSDVPTHSKAERGGQYQERLQRISQDKYAITDSMAIRAITPAEENLEALQKLLQASATNSFLPANSSGKKNVRTGKNFQPDRGFTAGLQWAAPLPLQRNDFLYTNLQGKQEPYFLLVPELWAGWKTGAQGRHMITVFANAAQQYPLLRSRLSVVTGRASPTDSTPVRRSSYLLKGGGYGLTLQYNYFIAPRFSVGSGIQLGFLNRALLQSSAVAVTGSRTFSDSLFRIDKQNPNWQYINPVMTAAKWEAVFHHKKISLGTVVFLPLNKASKKDSVSNKQFTTNIFLRWRLK